MSKLLDYALDIVATLLEFPGLAVIAAGLVAAGLGLGWVIWG